MGFWDLGLRDLEFRQGFGEFGDLGCGDLGLGVWGFVDVPGPWYGRSFRILITPRDERSK